MARVIIESSHVSGDERSGALRLRVLQEDPHAGISVPREIVNVVPPDFHTHNDLVAAAVLTLVGLRFDEVEFNFPISSHCAAILERYYRGVRVGPIDPSLPSRTPGSRMALNFSGGLDSTAVRAMLEHMLGSEFAVVTSEYGRRYAYEAQGYAPYRRDVSCATDLREHRFDRNGRFNFFVPLLFAEYLDLGSITTGHALFTTNDDLDPLVFQRPPHFLREDLVAHAGGLEEVHLSRGIHTLALYTMLLQLAPERAERALPASALAGTRKHYMRAWVLRAAFEDLGMQTPPSLRNLPPPKPLYDLGGSIGADITLLWFVKREGRSAVTALCPQLRAYDLSFLDDFSFDFIRRYHPRYLQLVPQPLQERTLTLLEDCNIEPCTAADLEELTEIRRFFAETGIYPYTQGAA